MKIVMAIINPFKFDEARDALIAVDCHRGQGIRKKPHRDLSRCRIRGELLPMEPRGSRSRAAWRDRSLTRKVSVPMAEQEASMGPGIMPILAVLTLFGLLLAAASTQAQEHHANHGYQGQHGVGHEHWHQQFYSKLMRKDTRTSCCNLSDCVPTQSRMINDHYEVLVEGEWTKVPQDVIQNVAAPDGGAHVCFPKQPSNRYPKGTLFCVVLPPET
jgi:hypothetical protein